MYTLLDLDNWNRKAHFDFFTQFDEPFFSVTSQIDCTIAYEQAKQSNTSFFLYYLFQSLEAANKIEPFKYRIKGSEVRIYDQINASATINRDDGTFGFSYMAYHNFDQFMDEAQKEITRVKASDGLIPAVSGENVIHYSALPWINFTSLSHARHFAFEDSCPKITFGMMTETQSCKTMPVSVAVHHALMDGLHVGKYLNLFQDLLNSVIL